MPDIPEDIKALEEKIEALKAQKVQAEKTEDKQNKAKEEHSNE